VSRDAKSSYYDAGCLEVQDIIKAFAKSRDGKRLAGGSSHKKFNCFILPILKFCHIPQIWNMGIMVRQDSARERFDF